MSNRGFTLVELFVVIAIIMGLVVIGMFNFGAWQRKARVERFTKEFYSDLQGARMRAAFTKKPQTIELQTVAGKTRAVFRTYSSAGNTPEKIESKDFPFVFTANSSVTNIEFNTRGLMTGTTARVICAQPNVGAAYDALIVEQTLTNLGKWTNRGAGCASENVNKK